MLLVRTKIGRSGIHGLGLFADEFIPAGTPVWQFKPGFDLKIPKSDLENFSESSWSQILNYAYLSNEDNYVLCGDDARFINHLENCNTQDDSSEEGVKLAAIDILPGDEITSNYSIFDKAFKYRFEFDIMEG